MHRQNVALSNGYRIPENDHEAGMAEQGQIIRLKPFMQMRALETP